MGLAQTTGLIQAEESCRLTAYRDSRGIWTIGWGYNLEAHNYDPDECEGMTWTQEQADRMLAEEIQAVMSELDRRWPKWRTLDEVRQAAIISSVYQLGAPGASRFFATIHALQNKDWMTAATQMLASKWAKQTPGRVKRNAGMIQTGRWPTEVNGAPFFPYGAPVPAPTLAKPAAPVLPPDRLQDVPGDGTTMGDAVRAVGVPVDGAVIPLLIALSKSKTAWGIVGMFGMQLLGLVTWDVAIRVGQQIYTVPDLLPVLSSLFGGLGIWGRITAKPMRGKP